MPTTPPHDSSGHGSETNSDNIRQGRRQLLSALAAGTIAATATSRATGRAEAAESASVTAPPGGRLRAVKLYTGPGNASLMLEGTIDERARTEVIAIHFQESPAHSSYGWHDTPEPQFVITLSGTLEFTLRDGKTFVLRPGDVLLSEDHKGSGHKWRLIDDQPWRRAYVVLKPGVKDSFIPNADG